MKKMLLGLLCAVALAGCGKDTSTDGGRPSQAQQVLAQAQTTYLFVSLAASTYAALPTCVDNGPKLCKVEAISKQIATGMVAAGEAIELAQKALKTGESPSTYAKVKFALDAAVAALRIAQSYGMG